MIEVQLTLRLADDQAEMARAMERQLRKELKHMPYKIRIVTDKLPRAGK